MWTAFPSSDYYGNSVAMADIQSHIFHSAHSREWAAFRFRQSPFSTIEMSVLYSRNASFAVFHCPVAGSALSISQ